MAVESCRHIFEAMPDSVERQRLWAMWVAESELLDQCHGLLQQELGCLEIGVRKAMHAAANCRSKVT